jgi:hypothetical protein
MKLLHRNEESVVVQWSHTEKRLLDALAETYPIHQPEEQPLSRETSDLPDGAESWLHAARSEEMNQNRAWLGDLVRSDRFQPSEHSWQQELTHPEVETLLQILNNIRVGAWARLGCPEILPTLADLLKAGADRNAWLMKLAGELQIGLLLALDATIGGEDPASPAE